MTKTIIVDLAELLRFYDETPEAGRHASAVKAIAGEEVSLALLLHYLERKGKQPVRVSGVVTTGHARGPRLDAWIRIGKSSRRTLFQVESKTGLPIPYKARRLP